MSNKFWVTIFLIVLLLSVLVIFFTAGSPGTSVHIYQDGNLVKELNISATIQPQSFPIESEWGKNIVAVETGRVRMLYADCPDLTCVHQGWVSESSMPIICLPHRLVVRLYDGGAPALDAVVG